MLKYIHVNSSCLEEIGRKDPCIGWKERTMDLMKKSRTSCLIPFDDFTTGVRSVAGPTQYGKNRNVNMSRLLNK